MEENELIVKALERGVRAEESARSAHHRLDGINGQIARNAEALGQFKERVSSDFANVQWRITEESNQTRALINALQLDVKPLLVKMALLGALLLLLAGFASAALVKLIWG